MTQSEVLTIALNNDIFKNHFKNVKINVLKKSQSACMLFTVDNNIVWAYGFDGVDLVFKVLSKKRSKKLLFENRVLIIKGGEQHASKKRI